MLYKGLGCSSNKPKAMKFLTMAKKNGIDKGVKFLAKHEKSKLPKLESPFNSRIKEDAKQNNQKFHINDAKSYLAQSLKYYNGDGILVDKKEAARFFRNLLLLYDNHSIMIKLLQKCGQ